MTAALVAIFCLILGVVCGLLFGRATNAPYQQAQKLKDSLEQVQSEYETYKAEVTQHFTKTAELVNTMTDNYRNVHTHLAGGAQTLCSGALQLESMNSKEALEAQAEEVVEPTTTAEVASNDVSTNNAAANDEVVEKVVIAANGIDNESESIKVDSGTVKREAVADEVAKPHDEIPAELLVDAAEQKHGEGRIH